jgi:hypothetical protein
MWIRYSNEDFDIAQQVAVALTDEDRKAGKEAPRCGYSMESWDRAQRAIREGTGWISFDKVMAAVRAA